MKRIFCFFLLFVTLFQTAFAAYDNADEIVYVTNYGECYHEAGCGYLHSSQKGITLEKAVSKGYRACSRCSPPRLSSTQPNDQVKNTVPTYDVSDFKFTAPEYNYKPSSNTGQSKTNYKSENSTTYENTIIKPKKTISFKSIAKIILFSPIILFFAWAILMSLWPLLLCVCGFIQHIIECLISFIHRP